MWRLPPGAPSGPPRPMSGPSTASPGSAWGRLCGSSRGSGRLSGRSWHPNGEEGESARSSLRGRRGSGSWDLERDIRCSVDFGRCRGPGGAAGGESATAGRGIKEEAEGKRTWWPTGGPSGVLTSLHRQFPQPPTGGKVPVPDRAGQGGKCQFRTGPGRGESASSGPVGDPETLAASRRLALASAGLCVPGLSGSAGAGWRPALPAPGRAVLTANRGR